MALDFLWQRFADNLDDDALIWRNATYSYGWLQAAVGRWQRFIQKQQTAPGTVVALEAGYSPEAVALFLALLEGNCVVVPLTSAVESEKNRFIETAQAEVRFSLNEQDQVSCDRQPHTADHPLYTQLRQAGHPGLVIFSSGSSGENKAVIHDVARLVERYKAAGKRFRTLAFMLYDHIGGFNTMLYTLANGGCLVVVPERSPDAVLLTIERHQVQLLPTSPTFLNLLLLSEAYKRYDLSSLKLITYGTEPMPESTLNRLHALLPQVSLRQTYGLSEVGILQSRSLASDSLWVQVGGDTFQTRVVDGILQIKARSAMLGYLNAPAPFTEDGWLITGDRVEVNGDYLKILGRDSEMINVGGEKVYPIEVESVIQNFDHVQEVTVYGEKNPITGQIVCARVRLALDYCPDPRQFSVALKRFCRAHLQDYKVPVKIIISAEPQHGARLKKIRRALS
jgi:long-chain acyl-CoA synthetase